MSICSVDSPISAEDEQSYEMDEVLGPDLAEIVYEYIEYEPWTEHVRKMRPVLQRLLLMRRFVFRNGRVQEMAA